MTDQNLDLVRYLAGEKINFEMLQSQLIDLHKAIILRCPVLPVSVDNGFQFLSDRLLVLHRELMEALVRCFFQKENIAILSCRMKDVHNHITFILYSTSPICICRSLFRKDYHEIKEGLYRLASLYAFHSSASSLSFFRAARGQGLTETPPKLP